MFLKKICLLLFSCCLFCSSQAETPFRVMFYNVENLFDTIDNPHKNDNDFLPENTKRWNTGKYWNKLKNLSKVITDAGEWDTPVLIGLCEVENETTLTDLTQRTPLRSQDYRFIITDCPDSRGINTALLYQRDRFKYLHHLAYQIDFPYNKRKKTRDVLHVSGQVPGGDTLDVFVCHFPSRRGGEQSSEPDRVYVAGLVKSKVDSLQQIRQNACVIIMGDLNDEPANKSISQTLQAGNPWKEPIEPNRLYDLITYFENQNKTGSYKFQSDWNLLDHIIVSGNLLDPQRSFRAIPESITILEKPYLIIEDKTRGGFRPKKTFHGMRYEGGYSDHLPVLVDFLIKNK